MKSECCEAPVVVQGYCTLYYVCTECEEACDVIFEDEQYKQHN